MRCATSSRGRHHLCSKPGQDCSAREPGKKLRPTSAGSSAKCSEITLASSACRPVVGLRSLPSNSACRLRPGQSATTLPPLTAPPAISTTDAVPWRSEEHTSELQSLMRISYAVFCLKKKKKYHKKCN